MKNVVIISIAFMFHFTAYSGAANLQSSINAEFSLGTASLAAVYAGLILSNIFLPLPIIRAIGTKWTISLSFVTYMPFIGAQLYPRFYTMIPTAFILGMGAGPLWCAKCTYLSAVSEAHGKTSKIAADALLVRFLGLFFMIFQMNQVSGNLISSLVLSSGENTAALTSLNATMIPQVCGSNFLPRTDSVKVLPPQPQEKIQMLAGIYLACMAGAAITVAIGVDSMKRYTSNTKSDTDKRRSGLGLLVMTLKILIEPRTLLLLTINIFIGLQQAFFGADFTAAFVSCVMGTGSVGFVMMTYGLSDAIGCIVTGYIVKITGRLSLILVAFLVHTSLLITILMWKPQEGMEYILYIIAVLWGICDSIWLVQINGFYGTLFTDRKEASYSSFRLWVSVGYILSYVISPYLRTSSKTYLMLAFMFVGAFGYFIVEYQERRERDKLRKKEKQVSVTGCDNLAFQNVG